MKHIPRFYVDADFGEGERIFLSPDQMHHAANVLRLKVGDLIRVFNIRCGEWNCEIVDVKKRCVEVQSLFRSSRPEEGAKIACSLINPKRFDFFLEKATELGVSEIVPIISQYTQHREFNRLKAEQKIILACEQSKRFSIPILNEAMILENFLKKYSIKFPVLVGDERCSEVSLASVMEKEIFFLVGPEGGFSEEECNLFDTYKNVKRFSFGNNILRSETAAIAFVSIWRNYFF
ncbi:MAG: 16S rRNA (uracil(1498)-N(3))-methyltransferase [Holosporaceae bacterium]|jgi:16S rRNA (uracil1498-N3)-methyltransferase|nr:16S rRNA (uracil(1498)-N(3))-methyltransferase [Holosporaceae bacterium]